LSFTIFITLIVLFSIMAAHHLDNKFFPADSPLLANYYPNDFLPWGVGIFMFLGFIVAGFLNDLLFDKQLEGIAPLVVIVVGGLIASLIFIGHQMQYQGTWVEYLGELALPWTFAWLIGGMGILNLQRNFGSAENQK
jgi:hypothetical protein